ncbi:hypothetical protein C0R05_18905 [Streptomyces albidoflavus]|nr:hypothetical protein C0R05_18905 [Streptomyces albidoflavus]
MSPPPPGLDLRWVWQIPVGTITIASRVDGEAEINSARLTDPSGRSLPITGPPVTTEDLARETTTTTIACPVCGTTADLSLRGRWGDPAELLCPCGHQWPVPGGHAYAIGAMTHAITLAIAQQGLPPAAPSS